jgi:Ca2+-binding RTX toxin-like protein
MSARSFVLLTACFAAVLVACCRAALGAGEPVTCFGLAATMLGTDEPDQLDGTPGPDVIVGLGGNDKLNAFGGDDLVCGGDGNDTILGGDGDDRLDAGSGNDGVDGGLGDDTMTGGGDSTDLLGFVDSPQGVKIDLAAGTASGEGTDTMTGFPAVAGSPYADIVQGDASTNFFLPLGGSDQIDGRSGFDYVVFLDAVDANLTTGIATAGNDRVGLTGIEGLVSNGGTLRGDGHDNTLAFGAVMNGLGGNDTILPSGTRATVLGGPGDDLIASGAGDDVVDGGTGQDTLSFLASSTPVQIDLAAGHARGRGTDAVRGIENVDGSQFDDTLDGDAAPNSLYGNGGDDRLSGRGGDDFLSGGSGANTLDGGPGSDFCLDGTALSCETVQRTGTSATGAAGASVTGFQSVSGLLAPAGCRTVLCRDARHEVSLLAENPSTLEALAATTVSDRISYAYSPTCTVGGGKVTMTIRPPSQVLPLPGVVNQTVDWYAELRRLRPHEAHPSALTAGVQVFVTSQASAPIAGPLIQTPGYPQWVDDTNAKYKVPTKRLANVARYRWVGHIKWEDSLTTGIAWVVPVLVVPGNARRAFCGG